MKNTIKSLKVVSDKTRLSILLHLKEVPQMVESLRKKTKVEPTLMSHHLKVLKDNGIVEAKRVGKNVQYKLAKGVSCKNGIRLEGVKLIFC